jgi:hypothetical protein
MGNIPQFLVFLADFGDYLAPAITVQTNNVLNGVEGRSGGLFKVKKFEGLKI